MDKADKRRIFLRIFDDHFEFGDLYVKKEDFTSIFHTNTIKDLSNIFGICANNVGKISKVWNLHKTSAEIASLCKQTKLDRYGDENYNNTEKAIATAIKNDSYTLSVEKGRQTKLERYGDPNYNNTTKNERTCLDRYGVKNVFAAQPIKDKIKQTCLDKHGVVWPTQSEKMKENAKKTFLERFNSTSYLGSEADLEWRRNNSQLVHEIRINTNKKLLEANPNFFKDISKKVCATKKENHTFNTSKVEEIYNEQFCDIFGCENVLRQYTDTRYPFNCDFYIKSHDLFIEINYYWTHGTHPFDPADTEDLKKLEKIRANQNPSGRKNSYWVAEQVWTVKDPQKLQCAILNNLNYMRIYPGEIYYDKQTEITIL